MVCGELILLRLDGAAELRQFLRDARALGFDFSAGGSGRGVQVKRALRAEAGGFDVAPDPREFVLANGQLEAKTREFALGLLVAMVCGEGTALCIELLGGESCWRLFR